MKINTLLAIIFAFNLAPFANANESDLHLLNSDEDLSVETMDRIDGSVLDLEVEALRTTPIPKAPQDQDSFCKRQEDSSAVPALAVDTNNLTAFQNDGGFFGVTGVCWWHSRLQRSALYLTVFHPERPAPSENEIHGIFKALQRNSHVVEIGGYKNWQEFSLAWGDKLQKFLNQWQAGDTFIRQAWFNGLMNRMPLHGAKAAARLKKLASSESEKTSDLRKVGNEISSRSCMVDCWSCSQWQWR
jgi:hypothetical protein